MPIEIRRKAEGLAREIEVVRAEARAHVAGALGAARLRFVTDAPAQAMIYAKKKAEAEALANFRKGDFPFMRAEAEALGLPLDVVADRINRAAARSDRALAALEAIRVSALNGIAEAPRAADVAQVRAGFDHVLAARLEALDHDA